MSTALQAIGIVALGLAAAVAVLLVVVGVREAPSLVRYLRIRRM